MKPNLLRSTRSAGIFDLMLEQTAGEIGRGEAIGFGDFADVVDRGQAAASAHVLDRDRRIAGNMAG